MTQPNNRPHTFDARVMEYRPGLSNLARKYKRTAEERYDLVVDTIAYALEKWENFREDGGMYNWLAWNMRGLICNQGKRRPQPHIVDAPVQYVLASEPPAQERYCELSEVLRNLPAGRAGDILLRRAMGEQLNEIGETYGISRPRVQQIELAARANLRTRLRMAA